MAEITCARCGRDGESVAFPPFKSELGQRIHTTICQQCWGEWLQQQTMLINHYGLNLRDPEARKFLTENTEKFLFDEGDTADIDTSKQGTISW